MKIEMCREFTDDGTGIRSGFIWTDEKDPAWMRFRLNTQTGNMTGMFVSRTGGNIPTVTPWTYNFASPGQSTGFTTEALLGIFANAGNERMVHVGRVQEERVSMFDQANAWQSFLGEDKISDNDAGDREITVTSDFLPSTSIGTLVKVNKEGVISIPRLPNFRIGNPMSGFDAWKVVASMKAGASGAPKRLKIGSIQNLDLDAAKKALASVSRPSSLAVTWYGTRDPKLSKMRGQAAQVAPVLAGVIGESHSMRKAVDELQALHPILTDRIGLAKAGLKRVGKLRAAVAAAPIFEEGQRVEGEDALGVNRARMTRVTGAVPIDMSLRYLKDLPPDRVPADDESWQKYHDILTAVAIPLHNAIGVKIEDILSQSKGNWINYHAGLAKAADFAPEDFSRRAMALTTIDAIEAIHHFQRSAVLPQILSDIEAREQPAPQVAAEFLNDGFDVARDIIVGKSKNVAAAMMEMARRYASRIPALYRIEGKTLESYVENIEARFARYGNDGWPPMTEAFQASNGIILRPLTSVGLLTLESDRLGHCVRGYGPQSRRMACHIYSLQGADGEASFSTVEFVGMKGNDPLAAGAGISKVQHRAQNNRDPEEHLKVAVSEFMSAVKTGKHPVNLEEINEWKNYLSTLAHKPDENTPRAVTANWNSVLEFDPKDHEARLEIWQEWGQVLGGAIAKADSPGAIYMSRKAQELVGSMSPRTASLMMEEQRRARAAREAAKQAEKEAREEPAGP